MCAAVCQQLDSPWSLGGASARARGCEMSWMARIVCARRGFARPCKRSWWRRRAPAARRCCGRRSFGRRQDVKTSRYLKMATKARYVKMALAAQARPGGLATLLLAATALAALGGGGVTCALLLLLLWLFLRHGGASISGGAGARAGRAGGAAGGAPDDVSSEAGCSDASSGEPPGQAQRARSGDSVQLCSTFVFCYMGWAV